VPETGDAKFSERLQTYTTADIDDRLRAQKALERTTYARLVTEALDRFLLTTEEISARIGGRSRRRPVQEVTA
jgi:hypothetical protein